MINDFFRRCLPYGMRRDDQGFWFVFNRDYAPLGWPAKDLDYDEFYSRLPVRIKFKRLTDANLEKIFQDGVVKYGDLGRIEAVYFYNDKTNPLNGGDWNPYFKKLKSLGELRLEEEVKL